MEEPTKQNTKGEMVMLFLEHGLETFDRVADRLKPNVLAIAVLVYLVIRDFGDKLIEQIENIPNFPPEAIVAILTTLITSGVVGLIAAMIRMFETPTVPADVAERMIREARKSRSED